MPSASVSRWEVELADEFSSEFDSLPLAVRQELAAHLLVLQQKGPQLGRPHVDTLKGSRYANMKELRFDADHGAWRVAFAFDPQRRAILLVGGDKSGRSSALFYRSLIAIADRRYKAYLASASADKRSRSSIPRSAGKGPKK